RGARHAVRDRRRRVRGRESRADGWPQRARGRPATQARPDRPAHHELSRVGRAARGGRSRGRRSRRQRPVPRAAAAPGRSGPSREARRRRVRSRRLTSRRGARDARSGRTLSLSRGRRVNSRERFVRGWEEGFARGPARVLGGAGGGYRGLLGAREWLYGGGVLKSRALPCRVVSIGNLTVGGTGKTPAVEVAVQSLTALGHRPAVVSRRYGRRPRG